MTFLEAAVLGLVQGLTEFLPISSTAHLRLVPALLGWRDPGAASSAIIQLGTTVAVVAFFRRELTGILKAFLRGIFTGKPFAEMEARLGWYIGLGTIPVGICGVMLKEFIETSARSLYLIAASLIVLALVLYVAERFSRFQRTIHSIKLIDCLIVGLAQAVALIPGSSRSGTTLTAGFFLGFTREAAARFSFLLSVPAVVASGLFELYDIRHSLSGVSAMNLAIATVVSAASGFATIAFLLRYLRTHNTYVFIFYRLLIGVLIFFLLASRLIPSGPP